MILKSSFKLFNLKKKTKKKTIKHLGFASYQLSNHLYYR